MEQATDCACGAISLLAVGVVLSCGAFTEKACVEELQAGHVLIYSESISLAPHVKSNPKGELACKKTARPTPTFEPALPGEKVVDPNNAEAATRLRLQAQTRDRHGSRR